MAATERTPLVGGAERARFSPQRAAAGLIVCACALAAVQLGSHLSSNANLLTTELTEQSGQGFFSALMTSGSFMMMQAGAFAETLGSQAASAAAPAAPAREAQPECAEACETCDIPAVVAASEGEISVTAPNITVEVRQVIKGRLHHVGRRSVKSLT